MSIYFLNRTLRNALLDGPKQTGTYDPDEVLPAIEEHLTHAEYLTAKAFLTWVKQNGPGYGYGHGNIDEVFAQFVKGEV